MEQDFDLNIAPIIDCFTVLIAYLLISASFISIGFFDVGVSTVSEVTTATSNREPQESLSIVLGADQRAIIKLTGVESSTATVAKSELATTISAIRKKWPALVEANVSGESQVEYHEIIDVIEIVKKEIPKVFVGE